MKFNIKSFRGNKSVIKVGEMIKDGKNVYKSIKGHEKEINQVLVDLPDEKTGFVKHTLTMNYLYPGKVNGQFRMTRGHSHRVEEVYLVLEGSGKVLLGKKSFKVKKGDLLTVPNNLWHRTVNTGKKKLIFLTIFGKHGQSHLKKY